MIIMTMFRAGVFALVFLSACGAQPINQDVNASERVGRRPVPFPSQIDADRRVVAKFAEEMSALGNGGANVDANGLLNENRNWGALYSPRFQMDAGTALRVGAVLGKRDMLGAGFRAINVATGAIAPDGVVISRLPEDRFPDAVISAADLASGAAFFLADACSGMLAVEAKHSIAVSDDDWQRVVSDLSRALIWLDTQHTLLKKVDARAPNRLFFDALAFQACGELTKQSTARAAEFVALALEKSREDGVFEEGGGSDTTYQAVSVRISLALLLAGYDGADAELLWTANISGARWLAARVRDDGTVDSSMNTRTCAGGEAFMGREKRLSLKTVFQALAYSGMLANDVGLEDAAARVSAWARDNPKGDPCR
jgi:hypothetical protein